MSEPLRANDDGRAAMLPFDAIGLAVQAKSRFQSGECRLLSDVATVSRRTSARPRLSNPTRLAAGRPINPYQKTNGLADAFQPSAAHNLERASAQRRRIARSLSPTSAGRLGISRVQDLAASFRQGKELWCKPYYPIGMG